MALSDSPGAEELQFFLGAKRESEATRPLPACIVATAGSEKHFNAHVHDGHPAHCWIRLEDGSSRDAYQDENWTAPYTATDGTTWGRPPSTFPATFPSGGTS